MGATWLASRGYSHDVDLQTSNKRLLCSLCLAKGPEKAEPSGCRNAQLSRKRNSINFPLISFIFLPQTPCRCVQAISFVPGAPHAFVCMFLVFALSAPGSRYPLFISFLRSLGQFGHRSQIGAPSGLGCRLQSRTWIRLLARKHNTPFVPPTEIVKGI